MNRANASASKVIKTASRWDDRARDTPVRLTSRDLDFLYAYFVHGALSNAMQRELHAPDVDQRTISERLKRLKRAPNALIEQPWQQRASVDANSSSLIRALSRGGLQALVDRGRITPEQARWYIGLNETRKTFEHDAMASHISASIEIGCRRKGVRFISWVDIFSHASCPTKTRAARNPLAIPYQIDGKDLTLIPDGLCGIEHEDGFNFFAIEADRNTEPVESSDLRRSSYARHLLGYRAVLRQELYKQCYGLPNMQVLNVTVSTLHMMNIMTYLERETREAHRLFTGPHPFLFKAVPELSRRINKPPVSGHMLTGPWKRVGEEGALLI